MDYITKWIEVDPMATITVERIGNFNGRRSSAGSVSQQ
jgi:hypothetical protein